MATYKVIQDIEAEDHILGPLSFRQFVFGLIAAFLGYLCFLVVVKQVAFLLVVLLPPTLFCAFFAFPFGGDQPTETWALAKLRFFFIPRKRVWNQSGIKEMVTINVPKKIERVYTDGLSQGEVKSRLQALANTIDSRGWAIKHINAVGYLPQRTDSDRLIDIPNVPGEVPNEIATPEDDIMDTNHNPVAQQFETMIAQSSQERRERLMEELRKPLPAEPATAAPQSQPQWFINHNPAASAVPAAIAPTPVATTPTPTPSSTAATPAEPAGVDYADLDRDLGAQLKQQSQQSTAYSNLRTLQPLGTQTAAVDDVTPPHADTPGPMTAGGDPAILSLSKNNDLNVATLAREAQRAKGETQDEVVISLH